MSKNEHDDRLNYFSSCYRYSLFYGEKNKQNNQSDYSSPMLLIECGEIASLRAAQKILNTEIKKSINKTLSALSNNDQTKTVESRENFFQEKPRLWMTLFYVGQLLRENEKEVAKILKIAEESRLLQLPENSLKISNQAAFFGKDKDEIVLLVSNPGPIKELHDTIKTLFYTENKRSIQGGTASLFNTETWETFAFIPHVSLGRICTKELKTYIDKNYPTLDSSAAVAECFTRIQNDIFPQLQINNDQNNFPAESIHVYGYERTSIARFKITNNDYKKQS